MSATYVPTAYYHPTTVLPSPSDWATAASVNERALKYLTDNDKYFVTELGKFWDGTNINVPSGSVIAAREVRAVDVIFSNAGFSTFGDLNVFGGGTIGGALTVGGLITAQDDLMVMGNAGVNGTIIGGSTIQAFDIQAVDQVFAGGSIDGPGGVTTIGEDLFIQGQVIGDVEFEGNAQFSGNIELAGEINSLGGDDVPINANVQITGNLDVVEPSHVPFRSISLPDADDLSLTAARYNYLFLFNASATRTFIVNNDEALDGDWFFFINRSNEDVNIYVPVGGTDSTTISSKQAALYLYTEDAGGWRLCFTVNVFTLPI